MHIDIDSATLFTVNYEALLLEAHKLAGLEPQANPLAKIAYAREAMVRDRQLAQGAADALAQAGRPLPAEVLLAVQSLQLANWVYLKDMSKYSILMDMQGENVFAVLGLTQPMRDIVGRAGVALYTGLVLYQGRYVCDGLIGRVILMGRGLREGFDEKLRAARLAGRIQTGQAPTTTSAVKRAAKAPPATPPSFSPRQGQYLAFIHTYAKINGQAPAEADIQHYFGVSAPSVHQMLKTLEANGLIARTPGKGRSIRLLLPASAIPVLV